MFLSDTISVCGGWEEASPERCLLIGSVSVGEPSGGLWSPTPPSLADYDMEPFTNTVNTLREFHLVFFGPEQGTAGPSTSHNQSDSPFSKHISFIFFSFL